MSTYCHIYDKTLEPEAWAPEADDICDPAGRVVLRFPDEISLYIPRVVAEKLLTALGQALDTQTKEQHEAESAAAAGENLDDEQNMLRIMRHA